MIVRAAVMINLLGERHGSGIPDSPIEALRHGHAWLHLYGKKIRASAEKWGTSQLLVQRSRKHSSVPAPLLKALCGRENCSVLGAAKFALWHASSVAGHSFCVQPMIGSKLSDFHSASKTSAHWGGALCSLHRQVGGES